ncbi:MAG: universal stress protein [Treponema sp.]|nr:universal stress protein [Treponema sp.]MBP5748800.1 universal stress protein [Treponema sp.]
MIKPLFQRILVGYNGTKSSLHAVMYAILMAKIYKCHVKVVYVVDTATIKRLSLTKYIVPEEGDDLGGRLQQNGGSYLDYASDLAKTKAVKIETELLQGEIWSEIIRAADDYKADLILLGGKDLSNSYSSLDRKLAGEQQSEIIGSAHCSVLVVRQKYIEQLFKIA